jgi:hypothetical protein
MAQSKNNVVTYGLSGIIGDLLQFRQSGGKTVVSKRPVFSGKASEKQQGQRYRFQQATVYGKNAIDRPEIREQYAEEARKKKGISPYNVAIADFFNAPDIRDIDLSAYTGQTGDEIRVLVSDDFAVKSVHIQINNADGSLVEDGYAVHSGGNLWIYAATRLNEGLEGDRIVITASDLPGNIATEEQNL